MNKSAAIILTLFILSSSVIASAQINDEKNFQIGIKGGLNLWLVNPVSDSISNYLSVGGEFKYWFANNIGLGCEVQWSHNQNGVFVGGVLDAHYDYTVVPFNLDIFRRFQFGSDTSLYIGGGASFVYASASASASSSFLSLDIGVQHTAAGFNGVAGVEYGMLFLEAQWLSINPMFDLINSPNFGGISLWTGIRF